MKRLHAVGLFVLGLAAAGAFSGAVIADVTTSTSTSTTDVTTTAPPTTTAPTTTTPPTNVLPQGVRVAGVRVGGLTPAQAVAAVREAFARPLPVLVDRSSLLLDPTRIASAYAATAVARARIAEPGTNVRLVVGVRGAAVHHWVAAIEKRFARTAADARLTFRNAKPVVRKEQAGRRVDSKALTRRIISALNRNSRLPLRVRTRAVEPKVTSTSFDDVIVINREINRLYLYDGAKLDRSFPVATGQSVYPTPRGLWHIVVMWKNPWWYPPVNDTWAKGLKPVPPGPGNPLGTRWMGLDSPGVGIHGTDDPASIGYSASHGCIRMQVPDAEWLFDHVEVGTTVYIV
ncbi:MAG TPA: L,D-transpeptidase family protein [Gaiellaceae bacterium]|nr:L,D-transpeptidase family protein [Gaiellaceae bacterium]